MEQIEKEQQTLEEIVQIVSKKRIMGGALKAGAFFAGTALFMFDFSTAALFFSMGGVHSYLAISAYFQKKSLTQPLLTPSSQVNTKEHVMYSESHFRQNPSLYLDEELTLLEERCGILERDLKEKGKAVERKQRQQERIQAYNPEIIKFIFTPLCWALGTTFEGYQENAIENHAISKQREIVAQETFRYGIRFFQKLEEQYGGILEKENQEKLQRRYKLANQGLNITLDLIIKSDAFIRLQQ